MKQRIELSASRRVLAFYLVSFSVIAISLFITYPLIPRSHCGGVYLFLFYLINDFIF